jgi:hypothetical protein
MRIAFAGGGFAALILAVLPGAAHAWTRSYVVEWFEPAFYYGATIGDSEPGTDCTQGTILANDWKALLKTSYRTDAEVADILDPEKHQLTANAGLRGLNKENVYEQPWSVPDPGMQTVTGTTAFGLDLDGNAANGFTSPTGAKGIDNQYYKAAGCWSSWRGPARNSHHAKYVNDGMRDGVFAVLIVVSGQGADPANDSDVKLGFYLSKDKLVKDANGAIARDYSFRVNPDPRFQSVVPARTVGGVVESTAPAEVRLHDIETAPFFPLQLKLLQARVRLEVKPDGSALGLLGGYRNIDDLYTGWAAAGAIHESTTHINLPAYWYALHRYADYMPDPKTGQNTAISTAYHLYLTPAFVVAPDGDRVVAAAQLFDGPNDPSIKLQPYGVRPTTAAANPTAKPAS